MLLATLLQSRVIVTWLNTECCSPVTDVGDGGALEIILKHNHYRCLLACLNAKTWKT
jgi:hypothetical protein